MEPNLKELIAFGIKRGTVKFVSDTDDKGNDIGTYVKIAGHDLHPADCSMEDKNAVVTEVNVLNSEDYRDLVETKIEECLTAMPEAEQEEIIKYLKDTYIEPDDKLHLCIGFYNNQSFKCNTVIGTNLAGNIEYNRVMRPGRFYFVDGEPVVGGMLKKPYQSEFIAQCKAIMKNLDLKPKNHDTAPYE